MLLFLNTVEAFKEAKRRDPYNEELKTLVHKYTIITQIEVLYYIIRIILYYYLLLRSSFFLNYIYLFYINAFPIYIYICVRDYNRNKEKIRFLSL